MPTEGSAATPSRVGRYLLVESLGQGGMGRVHRARAFAAAGVTKDVCIKRIRNERLERAGAAERFVSEARLTMRLVHGNIVPVFDFGRSGGEYFLAMEWIDGADLRAILRDLRDRGERLAPEVVAHVGAEVARALAYAHDLGGVDGEAVVHRDVKPGNVLISRAGDVKLTDFGVATVVGSGDGSVGGTPAYMAPEQRRGEAIDARADLYGLGVMLCEMLTGERSGTALDDHSDVPEELRTLVARLVREGPDERPASAREVAIELERIVGRARGAGAAAPRDVLADRAARLADEDRSETSRGEIGVDASFLRDGTREDFVERMAGTTLTVSAGSQPTRDAKGRERPRRRGWIWLAVPLALAVAALVAERLGSVDVPEDPAPAGMRTPAPSPAREDRGTAKRGATARPPAKAPPEELSAPEPSESASSEPAPAEAGSSPPSRRARPRRARPEPPPRPRVAPAAPAHLNVNAIPWAEVTIDGRPAGITPLFGVELTPGPHTLRFVNAPLGLERETHVTLGPGDRRDLVMEMR